MSDIKADQSLDLKGVACPNNFVRAKLKLEYMNAGEILEVFLDPGEPIKNVPRGLKDEGHEILEACNEGAYWKILVRRA